MSRGLVTPGHTLKERAAAALADPELQGALRNLDVRLHTARAVAEEHSELKDRAAVIRRATLADLDGWIDRLEASLERVGATVHRCATPGEARQVVLDLARREGVTRVVKSKSMATEEIELTEALEAAGIETLETDLGEYVVQVAGERPSHIITPVIHKTLRQIADVLGREAGEPLAVDREALTAWVRDHLRERFLEAEMGITGVNFAAADTGTIAIVTNEGNGRLCTALPRLHVAVMPVEKVIPRFADLATLLPLLTMSATGQRLSNYVSMITGPRTAGEVDGPEQLHVIFLDHNRRVLLGTPYEDMLACIRCGACLNVCPVYRRVGGHAYDAVYTGPMGKVLTPLLSAGTEGRDLPYASTLCGACTEACPVEIPLADLLVRLRADLRGAGPVVTPETAHAGHPVAVAAASPRSRHPGEGYPSPVAQATLPSRAPPHGRRRRWFGTWARLWSMPGGYRASTALARVAGWSVPGTAWARRAPGLSGWTRTRDLPLPARTGFRARWRRRARGRDSR